MPGSALSRTDHGRLAELEHVLADRRTVARSASTLRQLAELVDADVAAAWSFDADGEQLRIANPVASGALSRAFFGDLDRGVRGGELGFLYSPRAPESAQRGKPFLLPSAHTALGLHDRDVRRLGHNSHAYQAMRPALERTVALLDRHGLAELQAMRVVVCDGPQLVAYVVIYAPRLTPRQQRLFAAASDLLGRREIADHRLAGAELIKRGLDAALELIGRSAFLVDSAGRILHANQRGELAIAHDKHLAGELAEAIREPRQAPFEMVRFDDGPRSHHLLVRKADELGQVAASFARAHHLGERTSQVLVLAVSGESTKHIASKLQIAESTVDYHLTRLYRRFAVRSRVELQRALMERLVGG